MKTPNIADWTEDEIVEAIDETVKAWTLRRHTKNEALYPILSEALAWLVLNYLHLEKEDEETDGDE